MPRGPLWSEREEAILIKAVNEGKKPSEISKRFKELHNFHDDIHLRSAEAISRHLRSIKSRKNGIKKAPNSGRKWGPDDDHRLLELYRDTTLEPDEIALRLHRTEGGVKTRVKTLGIGHLREPKPGILSRLLNFIRASVKTDTH